MGENLFTKQKAVPFIGTFRQLFGGASTWITLGILTFSGMAAWSSPTMITIREFIPWLNVPVFIGIIIGGMAIAMWLEHKFVQPSVMVYWNHLQEGHGNTMLPKIIQIEQRLKAIEDKLDKELTEK